MKNIFVVIYLSICLSAFSQDIESVYMNAPYEVSLKKSFQREKWFYEQRMFPLGFIPVDAFSNAQKDKANMQKSNGFFNKLNNWFSIGPTPGVNTYYGNVSSRIATVKFHPTNPDIIYVGAACGGIWKTTNSGQNWIPKSDFEVSLSSGAIALDNLNPDIIYYGTGETSYFTYSYYGAGILKSTNGGESWTNYRNGLPSMSYFSRLVLRPGTSNILFAALGTSGLYKSTDAGQNWFVINSGRCDDIVFSPDGTKAYIIGQGCGYRISTDGGNTFTQYTPFTLGTRNHLALCKSSPEIIYASVYTSTGYVVSVYKSTDAGLTFALLQNNFTGTTQGHYDFYIHVNPFDANYAYVGLVDLWRTTNGSTFTKITNTSAGPVHVDHHNMDFHPTNPENLICANDGGVYYSTNRGTNWTNLNSTLNLTQFYRVTSDPSNASHILGGTQDNGVQQTQGSLVWTVQIFGGDGGDVCFDSKFNNYIITENQSNLLRRSVNGGLTWQLDTTGMSGTGAWIAPIVSHPDSTGIFYTARQRVFKSTNYGDTWTAISSGTAGTIREMAISKSNPAVMFVSYNSIIYKSTNGGVMFSNTTNGLPARIITSINIHPDSSNVVLVTFSGFGGGHIFKTTNGGVNWNDASGNLPDTPVNDGLIYYPGNATGTLIAATDVGVFITNQYGSSWSELANGLPNTIAMHLDYNTAQNKLRVATHGRGVWEYSGNIISIKQINFSVPKDYSLYQNYPNPFNPTTKIKFDIPALSFPNASPLERGFRGVFIGNPVILKVYDVMGREVQTLVNEQLAPGTYEVTFDASMHTSGIYFYKLSAGDFSETKKMILIK